jgi:hypothetical protein
MAIILNYFNSYDGNVSVYTGLGLGQVKQVVTGFGLASNDTGQLYMKHFDFLGPPPPPAEKSILYFRLVCAHDRKPTNSPRAVMSLCGGAARWSDVTENLLKG